MCTVPLVVPDVQEYDYLLSAEGGFDTYQAAMFGAYKGFFDNNILVDWVQLGEIDQYNIVYFPYPIMFTQDQADQLRDWVAKGGILISEACPGYFGDHGRVGTVQPNLGLDSVFGAVEQEVEFMPDIASRYQFNFEGLSLTCGGFLQSYTPNSGQARGTFADGRTAIVENTYKAGRTLLIGSHPSVSHFKNSTRDSRTFFKQILAWAGIVPQVKCSNQLVQARLQEGSSRFLWLVNSASSEQFGQVSLRDTPTQLAAWHWGEQSSDYSDGQFRIAAKDVIIIQLRN